MKVKKDKTPYGADVTEFETKVGRFHFKGHVFIKEGDISYELSLGNVLQRFNSYSNIDKLKKSLDQEQERLDATKGFVAEIENYLNKDSQKEKTESKNKTKETEIG